MLPSYLFSEGKRRDPVLSSPYCIDQMTDQYEEIKNLVLMSIQILLPSLVDPVSSAPVSRKCAVPCHVREACLVASHAF